MEDTARVRRNSSGDEAIAQEQQPGTTTATTAGVGHPKPMLTVEQQIAHMKDKGITFDLVSEEEAAKHLRTKCQFFRIYAYRRSFAKREGGPRDGQYIGLDFGHLKELSNLDRMLRDTLFPMTLDVEHFAKIRLLAAAEDAGEDGYTIMHDYREHLTEDGRSRIDGELARRLNDPYAGQIVKKYLGDMPIWAFCEVVPFGIFTDLVKFCAARWDDDILADIHYQLKNSRQIRNAGAHGACILNDVTSNAPSSRAPAALVNAMGKCGIPRRLRAKWLRNRRMVQVCSLLYLFSQIVPAGSARSDRAAALARLFKAVDSSSLPPENPSMAALLFIERLTTSLGLLD